MTEVLAPRLTCTGCKQSLDLSGKRVGDSIRCPGCKAVNVITRSRVQGELPPAVDAGAMSAEDQAQIDEALHRIKLRRVGHATRHVELYPSWAVFVAGVQFYLSGFLAGQNLIALGEPAAGRRLQVTGVVSYLALGALFVAAGVLAGDSIPLPLAAVALLGVPLAFAAWFTRAQHTRSAAAREAGARGAPVLLPLLLGLILAIAQAFAVWFLKLQLEGPL